MLQQNNRQPVTLKIKSIRKVTAKESDLSASYCSIEPDDGTGKPPC